MTTSPQMRLVFIIGLLAMAACTVEPSTSSNNATFTPSPDAIFFPKQELVEGEWIRMTGEVMGQLVEVAGCLRLDASHNDASYLVVWPPDYILDTSDPVIQLRNGAGQVVAHVGEAVHMGGGEKSSLEGVAGVNAQLLQEIPTACSGPYWISGGVILNSVD